MIVGNSQNISSVAAQTGALVSDQAVPAQNSAANSLIRDVVGNKTDNSLGGSIAGLSNTNGKHIHSNAKVYPSLVNGVTLTGGLTAWTLGVLAPIIPINTIASPFDIHGICVEAYNANDTFEIVLYSDAGGTIEIGRVRVTRLTNVGASPEVPFQCPIQAANGGVWGKVATRLGTSNTIQISFRYHLYS